MGASPTKRELAEYYEHQYLNFRPSLHLEGSCFKAIELVSLLEESGVKAVDVVLDLGCGAGGVDREIQNLTASLLFMVGCDISTSILQVAKEVNKNLLLVKADSENIPIKSNSVDVVLLIDLIEHLLSPLNALAESARISKKWVVIRTPLDDNLYRNLVKNKFLDWRSHAGHLQKFNLSFLKELICQAGLSIVDIKMSRSSFSLVKKKSPVQVLNFILLQVLPRLICRRLITTEHWILACKV